MDIQASCFESFFHEVERVPEFTENVNARITFQRYFVVKSNWELSRYLERVKISSLVLSFDSGPSHSDRYLQVLRVFHHALKEISYKLHHLEIELFDCLSHGLAYLIFEVLVKDQSSISNTVHVKVTGCCEIRMKASMKPENADRFNKDVSPRLNFQSLTKCVNSVNLRFIA